MSKLLSTPYRFLEPAKTGLFSAQAMNVPVNRIFHTYAPAPHIEQAMPLIRSLVEDAKAWFENGKGEKFNSYSKEHADLVRPRIQMDWRTIKALEMLNLPPAEYTKLSLPWWNEEACESKDFGLTADNRLHLSLGARHSWRTQLARKDVDDSRVSPIYSMSVVGLVHTADDKLVVNLRSGQNFPNTYYYAAGAMGATEGIKSGQQSVWDFFVEHELGPEYNMGPSDVAEAKLIARVVCYGTGDRDTSYVFGVRTRLTSNEFGRRYGANSHDDRQEHDGILYLSTDEVVPFVKEFYKGFAKNDLHRPYKNRVLLPQAAAPLLSYVGEGLLLMEDLVARPNWQPA